MNREEARRRAGELMAQAREQGVRYVNLQFTDITGIAKSVTIPVERLGEAVEHGKWFDGSAIEGFARTAESDMYLLPDLETFAILPWEKGEDATARVLCWIHNPNGELFAGDPRATLRRALDEARAMGFQYQVGPELEFFLFNRQGSAIAPLPHDRASYFDYSADQAAHVRRQMVDALQAMGVVVESAHHEVAAGQHEIDLRYADALATADNVVTVKYTLKAIAQAHDLYATFLPKPIYGINGSGMHCHQSLSDLQGRNLFADPSDEYGLSEIARSFIAGQLEHARGMCAVLSPLVNSYKRLVAGYEAPVYISWARVNRSALIRVPKVSPGRQDSTRLELRCPDPACNPYLAFAVMLKAGLDGIRRELPLPEPIEENIFQFDEAELRRRNIGILPSTLGEAIDALLEDTVVQDALGDHILERFVEAKRQEWDSFRAYVSQWELDRYFEVY
ncbi:MAG: glutamine synthetase [Dehalococcoidia bacterium]|nr:MAG: glutamine synthetase [Dehalococcoidia bacterium]